MHGSDGIESHGPADGLFNALQALAAEEAYEKQVYTPWAVARGI